MNSFNNSLALPGPLETQARALDARTLVYYRDLIAVLLAKEFKVRYKSTFLGYVWSAMHPLAFALILFLLFRVFMRFELHAYPLYLIAGLFPWQWISNTATAANFYFLGNSSLIKKVRFQRATLVVSGVLNELVHFAVSIPVVLACMLYYHKYPAWWWLAMVPLLVILQFAMTLGIGLFIATCNLFLRDLERLTSIAMQLLFYLTPIIYPFERIPPGYAWVVYANPFASIVGCWQDVFYRGSLSWDLWAAATAWSAACLTVGWAVYRKNVWRFAEIV